MKITGILLEVNMTGRGLSSVRIQPEGAPAGTEVILCVPLELARQLGADVLEPVELEVRRVPRPAVE